jgi:hypothetical protein
VPVAKKVHSRSSDTWILCAWFGCEKQGYELYKSIFHEHASNIPCARGNHVNFVFCTERHKRLFQHSHISMGKLPPGYRKSI